MSFSTEVMPIFSGLDHLQPAEAQHLRNGGQREHSTVPCVESECVAEADIRLVKLWIDQGAINN